jgi:hypothetical protein
VKACLFAAVAVGLTYNVDGTVYSAVLLGLVAGVSSPRGPRTHRSNSVSKNNAPDSTKFSNTPLF